MPPLVESSEQIPSEAKARFPMSSKNEVLELAIGSQSSSKFLPTLGKLLERFTATRIAPLKAQDCSKGFDLGAKLT